MEIVINKYGLFRNLDDNEIFNICRKNGKISKDVSFKDCKVIRTDLSSDSINVHDNTLKFN